MKVLAGTLTTDSNKYFSKKLFFNKIFILIRLFWPHPVEGGGGKWRTLKSIYIWRSLKSVMSLNMNLLTRLPRLRLAMTKRVEQLNG